MKGEVKWCLWCNTYPLRGKSRKYNLCYSCRQTKKGKLHCNTLCSIKFESDYLTRSRNTKK